MTRFNQLSWKLLESKLAYYRPDLLSKVGLKKFTITDQEYDALEDEYRQLAADLQLPPTAADMVGVDLNRPAIKVILRYYGKS